MGRYRFEDKTTTSPSEYAGWLDDAGREVPDWLQRAATEEGGETVALETTDDADEGAETEEAD